MADITIKINTDNAAFDENFITELTYVVNQIPSRVTTHMPPHDFKIRDSNGNTVGRVEVE